MITGELYTDALALYLDDRVKREAYHALYRSEFSSEYKLAVFRLYCDIICDYMRKLKHERQTTQEQ